MKQVIYAWRNIQDIIKWKIQFKNIIYSYMKEIFHFQFYLTAWGFISYNKHLFLLK